MRFGRASIVLAYAAAAVGALVWHAFAVPWNWGGFFLQAMLSFCGVFLFLRIDLSGLEEFRHKVCSVMLILCCLLWFSYAYFDLRAVAPLTLICFAMIYVWGAAKPAQPKLHTTLLLGLPLIGLGWFGLHNAYKIYRLRHLNETQVRKIEVTPRDAAGNRIQLTSESEIASFIAALRQTAPYLPNHERLNSPWQTTIVMGSGETISLDIGKGIRTNANTCRIQLGVTSYQNEALCRFLHSREPQSF